MTERQYADIASKLARIDERTKGIKEDLERGEERFEGIERNVSLNQKRIAAIEQKQSSHELKWRFLQWLGGICGMLGLGSLAHWLTSAKH